MDESIKTVTRVRPAEWQKQRLVLVLSWEKAGEG